MYSKKCRTYPMQVNYIILHRAFFFNYVVTVTSPLCPQQVLCRHKTGGKFDCKRDTSVQRANSVIQGKVQPHLQRAVNKLE